MKQIPLCLILSRIVFAAAIVFLAANPGHYTAYYLIGLIILGLLSDIFDGIIARHLNVSTPRLRRLDSTVDQVFWLGVIIASYLLSTDFYQQHALQIIILLALEGACYLLSFIRFKKEVATHAIASKLWTLVLFATLIQVIVVHHSVWLFAICFYLGIATRLEILAMLIVIRQWTNDIPTLYHAFKIRNNIPIKRHKLFNG